jgi:hypothetical protein
MEEGGENFIEICDSEGLWASDKSREETGRKQYKGSEARGGELIELHPWKQALLLLSLCEVAGGRDVRYIHAIAEGCHSSLPPRLTALRTPAGQPAHMCKPLIYKEHSLWPNLFLPLILPEGRQELPPYTHLIDVETEAGGPGQRWQLFKITELNHVRTEPYDRELSFLENPFTPMAAPWISSLDPPKHILPHSILFPSAHKPYELLCSTQAPPGGASHPHPPGSRWRRIVARASRGSSGQ